jgi:hypothetical protein
MIIFLYSNKAYERQAISCIKSMEPRIPDSMKIVYFTIGFISKFTTKNLISIPVPEKNYPSFHYYKSELSLDVMDMFPEETNFFFTDTDVLFSHRVNFNNLVYDCPYPLGVFGPHEYPFIWENINGEIVHYNEELLMKYLNVPSRTVKYQLSCFYSFSKNSYDFFEEYTSLCKNQYLIKRRKHYYPFQDETPFNVCLWKNNAEHSLGHVMVNTHILNTVKLAEETSVVECKPGTNLDNFGADWEYIHDSSQVILYHGCKETQTTEEILQYLLSK